MLSYDKLSNVYNTNLFEFNLSLNDIHFEVKIKIS